MVQTLLENAIAHGVEPKATPSNIHVTLDVVGSNILLRVVDDGVGFSAGNTNTASTGGTGIGLANIRERLQAAYGARATFTLMANTPSGVIAELNLPIAGTT
ncbi:MAG: hypothetical protein HC782_01170 [Gammaproteobacteria bacterium]|nr:hypothetical protein [Gammaproteobacteria bacterium]